MSGDEVFVLIVCGALAVGFWGRWYYLTLTLSPLVARQRDRLAVYAAPLLCGAALFAVLRTVASHDVRDEPVYLFFYMVMGAAWVGATTHLFAWLGVSARDDALERRNHAASLALTGMLIGATLGFGGGNIGDGPGWWVVVGCAFLATGGLALLWLLLAKFTEAADAITIDRDTPTGMRMCGFFTAAGLVLGRAVAGDYESLESTLADFAVSAWPVLLLLAAAIVVEQFLRPSPRHLQHSFIGEGVVPALAYIGAADAWVVAQGWW
jgi:hypothetical protein